MIATDRYYDRRQGKEFKKGETLMVPDEATAALLERRKKAKRDTGAEAPAKAAAAPPAPAVRNKVMRAETPAAPAAEPAAPSSTTVTPASTEDFQPIVEPETRPNRYRRNDMRSED